MKWKPIDSIERFHKLWEEADTALLRAELPDEIAYEAMKYSVRARECVAMNKTISEELIRELATDEDEKVRKAIASKRNTPNDVKMELTRDPSAAVRHGIAGNAKAPMEALELLAEDDVPWLRDQVRKRLRMEASDE